MAHARWTPGFGRWGRRAPRWPALRSSGVPTVQPPAWRRCLRRSRCLLQSWSVGYAKLGCWPGAEGLRPAGRRMPVPCPFLEHGTAREVRRVRQPIAPVCLVWADIRAAAGLATPPTEAPDGLLATGILVGDPALRTRRIAIEVEHETLPVWRGRLFAHRRPVLSMVGRAGPALARGLWRCGTTVGGATAPALVAAARPRRAPSSLLRSVAAGALVLTDCTCVAIGFQALGFTLPHSLAKGPDGDVWMAIAAAPLVGRGSEARVSRSDALVGGWRPAACR